MAVRLMQKERLTSPQKSRLTKKEGRLAEREFRRFLLICAKPRKRINFRASARFFVVVGHFERKNRAARAATERH